MCLGLGGSTKLDISANSCFSRVFCFYPSQYIALIARYLGLLASLRRGLFNCSRNALLQIRVEILEVVAEEGKSLLAAVEFDVFWMISMV